MNPYIISGCYNPFHFVHLQVNLELRLAPIALKMISWLATGQNLSFYHLYLDITLHIWRIIKRMPWLRLWIKKPLFSFLCIQEIQNEDHDSFFVSVLVGLCCCCTHIIVLFYLHSKDPIKVSRLTLQPLVNLATFSHSPTHDLSIFLLHCTASRNFCAAQSSAVILAFKSSEFLALNVFYAMCKYGFFVFCLFFWKPVQFFEGKIFLLGFF